MKNLVAKAGVAAVTSVLFSSVLSVPEAKALDLSASSVNFATITTGSRNCTGTVGTGVLAPTLTEPFASAGAVEVGEFCDNESVALVEYDLTSIGVIDFDDFDQKTLFNDYSITFNVFTKDGSGSFGGTGDKQNSGAGHEYTGFVDVILYSAAAIIDKETNVLAIPPTPYARIDLSTLNAGNKISVDVTPLVRGILEQAFLAETFGGSTPNYFLGMLLRVDPNDGVFATASGQRQVGACGFDSVKCLGVTFNNFDVVPTPAAVLPALFGLASAAFRKKRSDENIGEEA